MLTEKASNIELASLQYKQADNMTDRLAAYRSITHSSSDKRTEIVDSFYQEWQSDTLVLDKWFAMQAMRPQSDTLNDVKALMDNSAFSMSNPNKVRSLIGAYASNLSSFHQDSGIGYQFVAVRIIELNDINPQIAARLVGVFNNWKAIAQPYSSLMKTQLERINGVPILTKDVKEIVSKALL